MTTPTTTTPASSPTSSSPAAGTPVVSVRPVVLPAPGRGQDLHLRVSAPVVDHPLPVILFSHGFGWSMDAYAPLVDAWAGQGFAVIQPTHLDSRTLGLTPEDPRFPDIWRHRVQDLRLALDHLDLVEAAVPGGLVDLDRDRVAAAGHSWGGQTVGMLLGARVLDGDGRPGPDMSDSRIRAGLLLATTGTGGVDLTPFAAEHLPFMNPTFAGLTTPTLVVAGEADQSALSARGPDWFTDAHHLSPGSDALLLLPGAEHSLGGIAGYGVAETTDEHPGRVALLQRLTGAYLRTALDAADPSWSNAWKTLLGETHPLGRLELKTALQSVGESLGPR